MSGVADVNSAKCSNNDYRPGMGNQVLDFYIRKERGRVSCLLFILRRS
jgi:hypothetical protein